MTKTNPKSHRIIALIAAGSVALGSAAFGVSTSPGRTGGDGFSTSPGRSAARSNAQQNYEQSQQTLNNNIRG